MGRLTTHVLDTAHGCPGRNVKVKLYRQDGDKRLALVEAETNDDGRCAAPLLDGADMVAGTYVLEFHAAGYFRDMGVTLSDPPFLDTVLIRFNIADPSAHYHVPLLLSPYGYSTYRGS